MNYEKILKLSLIMSLLILIGAVCVKKPAPVTNFNAPQANTPRVKTDTERATEEAKKVFAQMKTAGIDMSGGPCLSNEIIPDWVADVAHWPRQEVDNDPVNQCPAYRQGRAHHFVELDQEGNFIRAY